MNIEVLENINDNIYNEIKSLCNYSIYHSFGWHKFLEETFNWKVKCIIGIENTEILFFIPFVSKHRIGLKKYNIALPFSHNVGVLYKNSVKEELIHFANKLKIHLNNLEIHDNFIGNDFELKCLNYQTILDMSKFNTVDELYKSLDYKSIRYEINKSLKSNIHVENTITQKTINDFYLCELETRHRQGSPIYPKNFFANLFKFIPANEISMFVAYKEKEPLAGTIFFHNSNYTTFAYSASKQNNQTDLLLWYGIKNAFERGHHIFDFGTTPLHLEGLKKYKEKWGASSHELYYSYFPEAVTIERDGSKIKVLSYLLKNIPTSVFREISPVLLKLAI